MVALKVDEKTNTGMVTDIKQELRDLNMLKIIYITTPEGKFSDFNQSLLKMFGYSREEFKSLTNDSLFDDKESLAAFNEKLEQTGAVKDFEARLRRKNGSVLDCLLTSTAWRSIDGELTGYHGMIRDITIRKKTQELENIAMYDLLTGLPNRNMLNYQIKKKSPQAIDCGDFFLFIITSVGACKKSSNKIPPPIPSVIFN